MHCIMTFWLTRDHIGDNQAQDYNGVDRFPLPHNRHHNPTHHSHVHSDAHVHKPTALPCQSKRTAHTTIYIT